MVRNIKVAFKIKGVLLCTCLLVFEICGCRHVNGTCINTCPLQNTRVRFIEIMTLPNWPKNLCTNKKISSCPSQLSYEIKTNWHLHCFHGGSHSVSLCQQMSLCIEVSYHSYKSWGNRLLQRSFMAQTLPFHSAGGMVLNTIHLSKPF